jgi:hypothetical protein
MNKNTKIILFVTLGILSLFLIFYTSLWVHEFTHKLEYNGIEKTNETLCVLGLTYHFDSSSLLFEKCLKEGLGDYNFNAITQEGYDKGLEIYKTQEVLAYLMQSIYLLILYSLGLIFLLIQLKGRKR